MTEDGVSVNIISCMDWKCWMHCWLNNTEIDFIVHTSLYARSFAEEQFSVRQVSWSGSSTGNPWQCVQIYGTNHIPYWFKMESSFQLKTMRAQYFLWNYFFAHFNWNNYFFFNQKVSWPNWFTYKAYWQGSCRLNLALWLYWNILIYFYRLLCNYMDTLKGKTHAVFFLLFYFLTDTNGRIDPYICRYI